MYAEGRGVSQDHVRAHMWFSLFASRLTTDELPEDILAARDKVAVSLTREQRVEAKRLAREWDEAHPRN